jgi:hypothetical protein
MLANSFSVIAVRRVAICSMRVTLGLGAASVAVFVNWLPPSRLISFEQADQINKIEYA